MLKPHHVDELANPSELIASLLRSGVAVAFEASGTSMLPTIRPGDKLRVEPIRDVAAGDIVLTCPRRLTAHRVIRVARESGSPEIITRGDNCAHDDPTVAASEVLGAVVGLTRKGRELELERSPRSEVVKGGLRRRIVAKLSSLLRRLRTASGS